MRLCCEQKSRKIRQPERNFYVYCPKIVRQSKRNLDKQKKFRQSERKSGSQSDSKMGRDKLRGKVRQSESKSEIKGVSRNVEAKVRQSKIKSDI